MLPPRPPSAVRVYTWAFRALLALVPLAAGMVAGTAMHLPGAESHLALMLFLLVLTLGVLAGVLMLMAGWQTSVEQSFRAGYGVGVRARHAGEREGVPSIRLVE